MSATDADYFRDKAVQMLADHEAGNRFFPIDVRLILKAIVNRKLVVR